MNNSDNQPDWAAIAEKFDLWLPQIAPVGEVLLEGLAAQAGDSIIDLGSGTGEPALTRRMQGRVDITGVDSAGPMVAVAQRKVDDEGLSNIRFMHMPAEQLDFADDSFDRAMSRFGVMLFDDSNDMLPKARFSEFSIEPHTFHYRFESFDTYWDIVEASDIQQQYDALPKDRYAAIREEIAVLASAYMNENELVIPHEFLLATGGK